MTDFVQALRKKYVEQDDDLINQIYIPTDNVITTQIKLVGFSKVASVQKQLSKLANIDLSNQKISDAGSITSLGDHLHNVRVINLSNNHLDWPQLISILDCLPKLRELIITSNELDMQSNSMQAMENRSKFNSLTSLVIGRTNLKWGSLISIISSIWQHVEDLDLWDSELDCDDMILTDDGPQNSSFIQKILALRLSKNNFTSPKFLNQIGPLTNLTDLDLSHCNMTSFRIDDSLSDTLKNISFLNISYNDLTDWADISSLERLKKLKSLVCHENPLYLSAKKCKPLIVGRIGSLIKVNREEITRTYRRDSEIYYMRSVLDEYRNFQKGAENDFAQKHPRFTELAEIYGLPEEQNDKPVQDKYLTLDLYYDGRCMTKKVPRDMRVSNLRMLVKRLFKMSPSTAIRMTCCSYSDNGRELDYELEIDNQALNFYFVKDDKKVVITKID